MHPYALAVAAAALFGASTPASKLLLDRLHPVQLAGFLYLGAALAMVPIVAGERRRHTVPPLDTANRRRLAGAVVLGGIVGPVLLLVGLELASSTSVSLLLNFETAATAVLGAMVFREHFTPSTLLGVVGIVVAGLMLSWGEGGAPGIGAGLLVLCACICWAFDNHLTALIDGLTPSRSTLWKGFVASVVNLIVGFAVAPLGASYAYIAAAIVLGALSYGASIVLYITAAQHVGATRAQGVFASAPFIGAALSLLFLGEPLSNVQIAAGAILLVSIVAVLRGAHEHQHEHESTEHIHSHRHDDGHHGHEHPGLPTATVHTHRHRHDHVDHAHPHWPDLHHRHRH